jgi:hypothetical protein
MMPRVTSLGRSLMLRSALILTTAAVAVATLSTSAQGHAAQAVAAAACKTPADGHGWGPTYVTSMSTKGSTCAQGTALVKAYYACRIAHGGKTGKCPSNVLGYRCTEKRGDAIPTQFDAKVTCTKGSARIAHTYTQFT